MHIHQLATFNYVAIHTKILLCLYYTLRLKDRHLPAFYCRYHTLYSTSTRRLSTNSTRLRLSGIVWKAPAHADCLFDSLDAGPQPSNSSLSPLPSSIIIIIIIIGTIVRIACALFTQIDQSYLASFSLVAYRDGNNNEGHGHLALRGIRLDSAHLSPQGVKHDRRFIICRMQENGELMKVQIDKHPECGLFSQEIVGDMLHVRYLTPTEPLMPRRPEHDIVLEVPLEPDTSAMSRIVVNLHRSMVNAYSMGSSYDEWFSACFGFQVTFIYIGDERRPVLGTFSPRAQPGISQKGWLATLSGYLVGNTPQPEPDWLAFSDVAPYLVTSEQSLHNVSARLEGGHMEMYKFRPNIVVDGEGLEAFDEDLWAELSADGKPIFALTKLCNRCNSINIDYDTGRLAQGDRGTVLKKLMADRRIDPGYKWGPAFGKYSFLADGIDGLTLSVGDEIFVTKRQTEIPVTDWPTAKGESRFYRYN